jgi:purine-nucleoside phosphorylase
MDEFAKAEAARERIESLTPLRPTIGLILGSGLGAFAAELAERVEVPYEDIPHWPRSTAIGHAGKLVVGRVEGIPVAVMAGRVHYYEGYSAREVAFPVRVFGRLGIRTLILTNAAGGIHNDLSQGALVLISDHINLQPASPLIGPNDERFGPRFPDMSEAYSRRLRLMARSVADRLGIKLPEGVYVALPGPSYETPAEIHYLRIIGADLVGMSTVPEVVAANHMGMSVLGISCVTNMAAGILDQKISHEEVLDTGERVKGSFIALLRALIPRLAEEGC